ncbi:uncharacterized protein LOC114520826 [Dendronephthya gigantea]|uniref:uncharacterized protein LOC114520826 n=1 Tax=Dendronephthya gigantea TaxID=151771 RepID=UPI0010697565|nr:uncharacterized protein LOC114520826 [Dendronephthya gigantea]
MFTYLCISFGAGLRFVTMMNHLGLTVSWEKAMKFFDEQQKKREKDIAQLSPVNVPVILMIDNINIYRGKRKHLRLFKSAGPTMWNFTGQALLIPNVDGMDEVLNDKESCITPQGSATDMKPDDIFLESDDEKAKLFNAFVDKYLVELLDIALNKLPFTVHQFKEMTEKQIDAYIATASNFESTEKYTLDIPVEKDLLPNASHSSKSNVHILPLSLEDNSTIFGTMSILDKLSKDFSLPEGGKNAECVPFNCVAGNFDVISSRAHFELLLSQKSHEQNMKRTESQMRSTRKTFDGLTEDDSQDDFSFASDEEDAPGIRTSTKETVTLERERNRFQNEDKPFWEAYNGLMHEMMSANTANSEETYMMSISSLENRALTTVKDHLKRSLLHVAVEQGHQNFVKYLVELGMDVNCREGCGLTPLSLAVHGKNGNICKYLVESGAKYSGPLFTSVPSPLSMAKELNLEDIQQIFEYDQVLSDEEDDFIRSIDATFQESLTANEHPKRTVQHFNRTVPGFITPIVGDVGTCKTNSAVMSRSRSYQWVGLCPGDLHNKGYFCEMVYKVHGSSGFHYLLSEVLKRKRLTREVFKKKKFQENNLVKVREGINDACRAYGIAAALQFTGSNEFPSKEQLRNTGSTTTTLLSKFKEWLSKSCENDVAFKHRATSFLLYGPLQQMYDAATANGDGYAREAVYQAQAPMYAQLGFRNYYTEVFRHIVNFLVKWPAATRILLQKNCCVNLLGKPGNGIELDAYVESELVQPLKNYVSNHTTVHMCERLMANLNMFEIHKKGIHGERGI